MTTPTLVRTLTALVLVLWTALPALAQTTIARGPARNPFNGRLYLAVRNTAPANSAAMRDFARSLGGDLATIDDAAENEWVRTTFAVPLNAKLWIGLSDAASEGTFAWSDGSSATFRFWDTGEPSNSASSDAVLLNDSNGRWACRPDGATTVAVVELGHVIAVPQVAPTLTAAIDLASDASNVTTEVRLSPGTYRGTFDAGEKHLRIRGMGTASATVLDAEFAGARPDGGLVGRYRAREPHARAGARAGLGRGRRRERLAPRDELHLPRQRGAQPALLPLGGRGRGRLHGGRGAFRRVRL
jgi:hypothetical protein